MKKISTVALLGRTFILWGGGLDFLRLCASALSTKSDIDKIFLLVPEDNKFRKLLINIFLPSLSMLKNALMSKELTFYKPNSIDKVLIVNLFKQIDSRIQIIFYDNSYKELLKTLNNIDADIVLPVGHSLGNSFPFPWVGYIADLQHKYYSDFFPPKECRNRDKWFNSILEESKSVIVNAKAVKDDILKFYPNRKSKVFSLPFAPVSREEWLDNDIDLKEKYKLPDKFFIISNQFWVHKSHLTAFQALLALEKTAKIKDVFIVCTGKTDDYRFPGYFSDLKSKINKLNLSKKIIILGYIPKEEQIQIMKKAVAVIQPTLFEGGPGGGSVYDAVSLGVPAIISDISVNREIDEENILFFKAESSEDLTNKMLEMLNSKVIRPDKSLLLSKSRKCLEKFADVLLEAASCAISMR